MRDHHRAIVRYNPVIDAHVRWPGWRFALTLIRSGTEFIDAEARVFYLDIQEWGAKWPAGVAHAIAHLDLDHHKLRLGGFTPQHERDAYDLARLWMDHKKGARLFSNVNSI